MSDIKEISGTLVPLSKRCNQTELVKKWERTGETKNKAFYLVLGSY